MLLRPAYHLRKLSSSCIAPEGFVKKKADVKGPDLEYFLHAKGRAAPTCVDAAGVMHLKGLSIEEMEGASLQQEHLWCR